MLNCNVTVESDVVLTIESGVVVKGRNSSCDLVVKGFLKADDVTFTSFYDDAHGGDTDNDQGANPPTPGDWHGIEFQLGNNTIPESSFLNNSSVLYGGKATGFNGSVAISGTGAPVVISGSAISYSYRDGLYIYSGATAPLITNSTFSFNSDEGLESEAPLSTLSSNSFTGNGRKALVLPAIIGPNVDNNEYSGNGVNGMYLTGHITGDTTWPASNSPYVPETVHGYFGYGHMDVEAGVSLTIYPDSVVKFPAVISGGEHSNTDRSIEVYGELNADGVTFTSFFDDSDGTDTNGDGDAISPEPGDWYCIAFRTGSVGSITNSTLRYGDRKSVV